MPASEDQLRDLEIRVMNAAGRGDAASLAPLISEEFLEIGVSGRTYTKAEVLAAIQQAPHREFSLLGLRVRWLNSDCALLTYRARAHSPAGDETSCRSTVWVRRGDHWLIAFHQGTEVRE